jgi:hypothetical protein
MAAFCHPHPAGTRFADARRGAWYAAKRLETSVAETAHHRWRELQVVGVADARVEMRLYHADFRATFRDIRGGDSAYRPFLLPDSYTRSQELAVHLLADGANGILYPSVRHAGGECIACFRPALVLDVRAAGHFELSWAGSPQPRVRRLRAPA